MDNVECACSVTSSMFTDFLSIDIDTSCFAGSIQFQKNLFPYPVLWQDYLSTVPSRTPIIILLGICVGIPSMGQVNILPFVILESAV